MELLLPKDPAKYEAFMDQMDDKIDMAEPDPGLFYGKTADEDPEQK
jgi:hypothetical protein